MSQIRMTPADMRTRAGDVTTQQNAFEDVVKAMQSIIDTLQTEWEGAASQSFANQFEELKPSFQKMVELFADISTQLNKTADAYEELDSKLASSYGVS